METFNEFKSSFYGRVKDFALFDCADFNALKIVLDGLKVNYASKMNYRPLALNTALYRELLNALYRIKYRKPINTALKSFSELKIPDQAEYLIIDSGRVAKNHDGITVSIYFEKVRHTLGTDKCYTLFQNPCSLAYGSNIGDLLYANKYSPYTNDEEQLSRELKNTFGKISSALIFNKEELLNIQIAFDKFFQDYRFWSYFLKKHRFKKSFFMPHYHNEGFILALKRSGVKTIEIQHGLIAKEDIFYVFPKSVSGVAAKALFSEKIFTYGRYWVEKLLLGGEFQPSQIEIIGDYQLTGIKVDKLKQDEISAFTGNNKFILVTTQTFLDKEFAGYISWLSHDLLKNGQANKIIVKLHPAEKLSDYQSIQGLSNVMIVNVNVDYLLHNCSHHISIYSTTLYTALKYNCINYSLNSSRCSDYLKGLIEDGISTLLEFNENPLQKPVEKRAHDLNYYYAPYEDHSYKLNQA